MKIGIHQHVFTKRLNRENLDQLNRIRDFGFESVDINVRVLDIATARMIGKRARELNLLVRGGGSLPANKELLSSEPEKRREAIDYMKGLVDVVHELGSSFYGGIIYSPFSRLTGKAPTEEEFALSSEGLKEVARHAQGYGISVGLEPANRYETYMINTIGDALQLIDNIDETNVGILCDTFHMSIEEKNIYDAVTAAGKRLYHVHVCANDRGIPGSGQVRWDNLFKALKHIGYDGAVTIEGFVDNTADVASGACIWRKFASSPEEMAMEGLAFLRSMAAKYAS